MNLSKNLERTNSDFDKNQNIEAYSLVDCLEEADMT
jgi:hypothetical protein